VLQPARLDEAQWLEHVAESRADIAVVAAFGRLLPQVLLDVPRLGFINVHASLLPRWRGAAPIHRAVLAGDAVTGVTIMRVVLALDAGPMLASAATPIEAAETSEALEARLAVMGADLLMATLARMEKGPIPEVAQDETHVTYATKLERHESRIDWARPAVEIDRQIRGLQPWPLAAGVIGGRRVAFLRSAVTDAPTPAAPGTVLDANAAGLVVACSAGAVRITQVLPEGRRAMSAADFLNGVAVPAGTRIMPVTVPGPVAGKGT
jgi:methionyl-tRNA formyltransferase